MSDTHKVVSLFIAILTLTFMITLIVAYCQPAQQANSTLSRQTIVVYGFSIEKEVFTEEIFPTFQAYWREETGQEVAFQSVFTGSEGLTDAIVNGAPADVAILSNEQHAVWLHINDVVKSDWRTLPNEGTVSQSPIVIVVRPGNPLGIKDWADLARPGVKLVHPDPRTSGGAQWALLAEYGAALLGKNGSTQAAEEQLCGIWTNVVATAASSREALKQFTFGAGDAMVTYEQDALLAQARGATLDIVVPRSTIVSEHVAVIVDQNVKPWEREGVKAFVTFLWSQAAQEAFTHYYFRAVTDEALNEAVPEFHEIEQPFTVQDLGGWGKAYPEIIHGVWNEQVSK